MRRCAFLTVLLTAFLCAGCFDSSEGLLHFSFIVDYNIPEQTLAGDPLLSLLPPQPLPDIPIDLNTDEEFSSEVFDHLVRIKLRQLVFTITASSIDPAVDSLELPTPTADDWSFLESAQIWLRNPGTLEEGLVAFVSEGDPQLEPGNTTLSFACTGTDIIDYFDAGHNTTLIIRAVGTSPPDNVIFEATSNFKVTAALIK